MASCTPDITHSADPSTSLTGILHPLFANASAYTHDPFWRDLLIQASMGIFPKNFSYTHGVLVYNDSVNCFTVPISTTEPSEIVRLFRSCLQVYGCIYSEMDQWNMISDHMTNSPTGPPLPPSGVSWTSIKKKSQGIIVDKFISREVVAKSLNEEQHMQLRSILSMGISLGFFNKDNIVIDNYDIKVINGLLFDEETRRYSIDPTIKPKTKRVTVSRKTTSTRPQTYGEKWISYHDSLSSLSSSNSGSFSDPGSEGPLGFGGLGTSAPSASGVSTISSNPPASIIVVEDDN